MRCKAFLSGVADCAQNQACQNDDNANDHDQFNESERVVAALAAASAESIAQAFGTNAPTTFVICHSDFVIPAGGASRLLLQAGDDADERREESEHDRADNHRQEHNHDGFERRGQTCHRVIDLVVINIGDL